MTRLGHSIAALCSVVGAPERPACGIGSPVDDRAPLIGFEMSTFDSAVMTEAGAYAVARR